MIHSRVSFSTVYDHLRHEIYVTGGYSQGVLVKTCEAYSVRENKWRQLPDQNLSHCSSGLAIMGRYLYSFGGLKKNDNSVQTLPMIERLDLEDTSRGWESLPQMIAQGFADMGCVNLSDT